MRFVIRKNNDNKKSRSKQQFIMVQSRSSLFLCALLCSTLCQHGIDALDIVERAAPAHRQCQLQPDSDRVGWMRSVLSSHSAVGPFVMLDHWGGTYAPHEAVSGSDHPHAGQVTVSYVVEGGLHHEDSAGGEGVVKKGGVQWMNAGSGVVHSEMHDDEIWENGGTCEGFQLWINLPKDAKTALPSYTSITANQVPKIHGDGGTTSVLVGTLDGAASRIQGLMPMLYLDITVLPGGTVAHMIPRRMKAFGYVFRGNGKIGAGQGTALATNNVFNLSDGDRVTIQNPHSAGDLRLLLLAAEFPDNEPVYAHGPFVLSSKADLQRVVESYRAGQGGFGRIPHEEERNARRAEAQRNIQRRLSGELSDSEL